MAKRVKFRRYIKQQRRQSNSSLRATFCRHISADKVNDADEQRPKMLQSPLIPTEPFLQAFKPSSPEIFFLTLNPATFSWCNDTFFFSLLFREIQNSSSNPRYSHAPPCSCAPASEPSAGGRDREREGERARVCCLWISQDVKCLLTNLLRAFASCAAPVS